MARASTRRGLKTTVHVLTGDYPLKEGYPDEYPEAMKLDVQPVVALSRVLEQNIVGLVIQRRAAGREEDVNTVIPVGKRDPIPLMQLASTTGEGYILEPRTGDVAEQDIGHHVAASRLDRPEIYIKTAVIVDVAEVRAHNHQNPVESGFQGRVAEVGGLFVAVKVGPLAGGQLT